MADLLVKVPIRPNWIVTDQVQLFIGTENAADLASSNPAGGTMVKEKSARPGNLSFGYGEGPYGSGPYGGGGNVEIDHVYRSIDKCGTLPIGVKIADAAGNVSTVFETSINLADPPRGARNLVVAATASMNQALLSWDESQDI